MCNIALVSVIFLVVLSTAEIDSRGTRLLQGIFAWWGSVFSSAAFVVPRLVQVRKDTNRQNSGLHITGIDNSLMNRCSAGFPCQ